MKIRLLATTALLMAMAVVGGCDREGRAWEEAQKTNTTSAYDGYLKEYRDSPHAAEAEQRLAALRAAALWKETTGADSAEAYRRYLDAFPDGAQAGEARARLDQLEVEGEWQTLQNSLDVTALQAFAERHAAQPAAAAARERIEQLEQAAREQARLEQERQAEDAARTHRVQLAAFRSEADAERSVRRLTERLTAILGETRLEVGQSGNHYLVRTAPLKEQDARALCRRLKEQSQDCLVVSR